ncbi:MAG: hypothetical protein FJ100_21220 [Deltaproteobacteria bacterium]|nr:hypothetical protein [Deltaproteobacteria bacterium]
MSTDENAAAESTAPATLPADESIAAGPSAPSVAAEPANGDGAKDEGVDDRDAIAALRALPARLFSRLCRRIPLRPFLAELEKLDKAVFFRHFKGVRPQKIDGPYLERVIRKEAFDRNDGMLAQLAIFNWDEAEHRLYADLQVEVKKINEDVEAIEHITDAQGDVICDALAPTYDDRDIYIAFVINGVRVDPAFYPRRFGALVH